MYKVVTRLSWLSILAVATALGGCDSRQDRANAAFAAYQAATASGDLAATRRALGALVAADDSNPDYWIELGKVNLQLGEIGAAHDAFVRAHELDQANVSILAFLSQLALRTGNLGLAEQYVKELELIAPEDPSVRMTYGYVALRRGDFDEARKQADALVAALPYDPTGKILQARILLGTDKPDEAIALLRKQVELQPSDQASLRALYGIYEYLDRWTAAAWAAASVLKWAPEDREMQVALIKSRLRSGAGEAAMAATLSALPRADALFTDRLLAPWINLGREQREALVAAVNRLAQEAQGDRRIALARFLGELGRWPLVLDLVANMATLPVAPTNASANGLYGSALVQTGRRSDGLARLDAVIALDGANADALRGRAIARMQARDFAGAITDTQKLIAADRASPNSWLLLAAIHRAAGNAEDVRRVLWEGFHELPSDHVIYTALSDFVRRADGEAASLRLAEEFRDQRNDEMAKSFV